MLQIVRINNLSYDYYRSRLDVTQIFCDVDDFCQQWQKRWQQVLQLPALSGEQRV